MKKFHDSFLTQNWLYFWKNIHTDAIYTNDATLNRQRKTGLGSKTGFILLGPVLKLGFGPVPDPGEKPYFFRTVLNPYQNPYSYFFRTY